MILLLQEHRTHLLPLLLPGAQILDCLKLTAKLLLEGVPFLLHSILNAGKLRIELHHERLDILRREANYPREMLLLLQEHRLHLLQIMLLVFRAFDCLKLRPKLGLEGIPLLLQIILNAGKRCSQQHHERLDILRREASSLLEIILLLQEHRTNLLQLQLLLFRACDCLKLRPKLGLEGIPPLLQIILIPPLLQILEGILVFCTQQQHKRLDILRCEANFPDEMLLLLQEHRTHLLQLLLLAGRALDCLKLRPQLFLECVFFHRVLWAPCRRWS
mmetsp:Transcript_38191/g.121648  ORF Transcript_38191/g.121648 Transcript_38191/m.121648 type:complete len:274 (+) Transcript_38191:649-1470(+)